MKQIGIVAALPAELAPLAQRYQLRVEGGIWSGQMDVPGHEAVTLFAAAAGMGSAAATQAFSLVVSGRTLDAVVSYGWAGAISCGVKPPEIHTPGEVVEARTGERFHAYYPRGGERTMLRLVTLDHVARAHEKRPLAERYQAVLVDMEAATVARLARAHAIEFGCIKGVSDGYTELLPDFNRFLDANGQLRMPLFAANALLRPRYWASLARLGRNSRAAAARLSEALPAWLASTGLVS